MEYRNLGKSGLQVSVAGLGCNNFGRRCDQQQTSAVVDKAIDLGVTFFDTADVYGPRGLSEEFLGTALAGKRRDVIVATKFVAPMGEGPLWGGASRRYIFDAVEASLARLNTDYIDLYQIHFPDRNTPIEETLRALDDLIRQGKVRYAGCSNFDGWQVVEAQWIARNDRYAPLVSAQNHYNLFERRIERELVPACKAYGLSILPYFPLANGFLSGKYRKGETPPEGSRLASPRGEALMTDANFETLEKLDSFAQGSGHTVLELAVGWLASQTHVASVISGATSPDQVEQNVKATEWRLTPEDLGEVDSMTRRG